MADYHEIIPRLYLGRGAVAITQPRILRMRGVSRIVNLTTHIRCVWPDQFTYMHVKLEDEDNSQIDTVFEPIAQFMEAVIEGPQKSAVYVHCQAGVSRSATVVLYYLLTRKDMTLQEAYDHCKSKRSVIGPNLGFVKALCDAEIAFSGVPTFNFLDYAVEGLRYTYDTITAQEVNEMLELAGGNVRGMLWILSQKISRGTIPDGTHIDEYLQRIVALQPPPPEIQVIQKGSVPPAGERKPSTRSARTL